MEGLIPMVYRAMKKKGIRNQYSVLSPEEEAEASRSYNIADFYVDPPSSHVFPTNSKSHYYYSTEEDGPRGGRAHRRFNSFGGSTRSGAAGKLVGHGAPPTQPQQQQQLVRFRSQRILSCLTGH